MFRPRNPVLLALVLCVALAGAACGKSNKVGDKSLLNFQNEANARLGTTTTTAPPASTTSTTAGGKAGVGGATTTTAKATTTTTAQQIALEIGIESDSSASQFSPSAGRVYAGAFVRWTNHDTVPRSVAADNNTFASPTIAPGQSWTYQATKAGKFNYHDGTRPYAVASLEVLAR